MDLQTVRRIVSDYGTEEDYVSDIVGMIDNYQAGEAGEARNQDCSEVGTKPDVCLDSFLSGLSGVRKIPSGGPDNPGAYTVQGGKFQVDFKGNASCGNGPGRRHSLLLTVGVGKEGGYLPIPGEGITRVNYLTMTIAAKVLYLVEPDVDDRVFMAQLPADLQKSAWFPKPVRAGPVEADEDEEQYTLAGEMAERVDNANYRCKLSGDRFEAVEVEGGFDVHIADLEPGTVLPFGAIESMVEGIDDTPNFYELAFRVVESGGRRSLVYQVRRR